MNEEDVFAKIYDSIEYEITANDIIFSETEYQK